MRITLVAGVVAACLASGQPLLAQKKPSNGEAPAKTDTTAKTPQELNTQEYINLLRKDVGAQKAQLLGEVMQFDAEDAAKFWPIYRDYDAELKKVNDLRVANILEYSRSYTTLTNESADDLIKNAIAFQKQRDELLTKYYERFRNELGGVTAARFIQVEHQLLTIIDLKIASALPVMGSR